jgi:hypothetical protein
VSVYVFAPMLTLLDTGDGFGGAGSGGKRIAIDTEGLVLGDDGSFWISDEYGVYLPGSCQPSV